MFYSINFNACRSRDIVSGESHEQGVTKIRRERKMFIAVMQIKFNCDIHTRSHPQVYNYVCARVYVCAHVCASVFMCVLVCAC